MKKMNISRIMLLSKRYLHMYAQTLFIGSAAVVGFVFIILLLTSIDGSIDQETFFGITLPFVMISGYVFSSLAYPELNNRTKSIFYLTLPASSLERLLYGWLLTGPFFAIISIVVLLLLSLLVNLFGLSVFGYSFQMHEVFSEENGIIMGIYLVTQTIFLAGAAYFRRLNFLKVLLSLMGFGFILSMFSGLFSLLLFGGNFEGSFPSDIEPLSMFFERVMPTIANILFWGILAPFFLLVTYFSIKEREV